jgi:Ni/Co efflux regulator RcnB
VPERGYVAIPRAYRDRRWREGDYLPAWFRTYTVGDYRRLGLPRPPRGCEWVWLNGDVALIDRSDGYILDIARQVW